MTDAARTDQEYFDVIIVGAGISGIGAAHHLMEQLPGKSFLILEKMDSFGGTWLMHRYPGVRSDSDLYTFGYRFKPWLGKPIAQAHEIRQYMAEVIEDDGLEARMRFSQRVETADWSTEDASWAITATDTASGEIARYRCNFLWMCQGYYRQEAGFTPEWPGMEDFKGSIIHPQQWPDDLDLTGKKVAVIGSGATAATLIPAIADQCAELTMIQRSPTYYWANPNENDLAETLRPLELDDLVVHDLVRRKVLHDQHEMIRRSKEDAEALAEELRDVARTHLGPDIDVDRHFTPTYRPWQQRLAFLPDADLFKTIAAGKASVVTDTIDRFTATGIVLGSGEQVEADVVISATGLVLNILGDIRFSTDGRPVDFARTVTYRGMMFSEVPNLLWILGYLRSSWTLRVDLVADFTCRLLRHMDARGARQVTPRITADDVGMDLLPFVDARDFNAGYFIRGLDVLPRSGSDRVWQHIQDYWADRDELPLVDLDEPQLNYL